MCSIYKGHGKSLKSTGPPRPASASKRLIITAIAASSLLGLLDPWSLSIISMLMWEFSPVKVIQGNWSKVCDYIGLLLFRKVGRLEVTAQKKCQLKSRRLDKRMPDYSAIKPIPWLRMQLEPHFWPNLYPPQSLPPPRKTLNILMDKMSPCPEDKGWG